MLKIRCSAIGKIMPGKRKSRLKSTDDYLAQLYIEQKYGREKEIESKYLKKGTQVEEDSMTLYSRYEKKLFIKNEEHLQNDFLTGTPDIIHKGVVHDIKSSWDIFTFFANKGKEMNSDYYWQLMGYMALTGAKKARLAYCLVNTPIGLIEQEKRSLHYKTGLDEDDPVFQEACREIEKLCVYDDIPVDERVIVQDLERDEEAIQAIYERVVECREWMREDYGEVKAA